MTAAGIILAGGAQQIGAVFWAALAVAVLALAVAGAFFIALFKGIARWRERRGEDTQPMPPVDDSVRMLARWLDDDAIAELEKQLAEGGDGRG